MVGRGVVTVEDWEGTVGCGDVKSLTEGEGVELRGGRWRGWWWWRGEGELDGCDEGEGEGGVEQGQEQEVFHCSPVYNGVVVQTSAVSGRKERVRWCSSARVIAGAIEHL